MATTSKEGSRHANYPMIEAEVVTKIMIQDLTEAL